ncbi:MAG: hypothetical protein ABSH16_03145 [Sedimentisphaerales bacterium]
MSHKLNDLLKFLRKLKKAKIYFELAHVRDESIMVLVTVPGERWEIEYMEDGSIEVEVFRSDGIKGKSELNRLFKKFSD